MPVEIWGGVEGAYGSLLIRGGQGKTTVLTGNLNLDVKDINVKADNKWRTVGLKGCDVAPAEHRCHMGQLGITPGKFSLSKGIQYFLSRAVHFPFPISCRFTHYNALGTAQKRAAVAQDPYLYSLFSLFHLWSLPTLASSWNGTRDPRATQS